MSTAPDTDQTGPDDVPALLARLVDDAALFPPGNASMADAVAGHLAARDGDRAGLVGFFLCPVSRLPELIAELVKAKPVEPVELSLVVNNGLGGVPKAVSTVEGRNNLLRLRMVEMPAPSDVDSIWLERVSEFVPEDVVRVVEPRRPQENGDTAGVDEWLEGVRRVARHGCWPKLRCGGLQPGMFPNVDIVSAFLAAVCAENVPFKATAGLHHAVRHTDAATGFTHHGFLNLLVAVSRCLAGGDAAAIAAALAETGEDALVTEVSALPEATARSVRQVFASYGSCSLDEPHDDLTRLGLL